MATRRCTVTETVVDGDRCLILENPDARVAINADHGSHLYELTDLASGVNLLHQDPKGSRDYAVGAWYELFPNAGPACTYAGRDLSGHGDIQHRPWSYNIRTDTPDLVEIDLAADSDDLPFHVDKAIRFTADTPGIEVRETITNTSDAVLPYLWGHHITFGERFMTASARIELPEVDVYARAGSRPTKALYAAGARGPLHAVPGRDGGTVDLTRFPNEPFTTMLFSEPMPEHWYRISADDLGVAVTVDWDGAAFPVLWIWGTNQGNAVDPNVVACALEPQSCEVPSLAAAVDAGRAPTLGAGQSCSGWLRATLHQF